MIKWNVLEKDLDGMEVIYCEIDGMRGKIVDVFNDGNTVQVKIEHSENEYISVPSVQVMTLDKKFIVNAENIHHCDNCDIRLFDNSDASKPVYVELKKCVQVCADCRENDSIYFFCCSCGEWNKGDSCFNCGEKRDLEKEKCEVCGIDTVENHPLFNDAGKIEQFCARGCCRSQVYFCVVCDTFSNSDDNCNNPDCTE